MRDVIVRAPARIDFGGGWTDVPPCAEELGGRVCNLAIDRYAHVRLRLTRPGDDANSGSLARAVLRAAGIPNVAIDVRSDMPTGAGLGGSSAACVAMVAACAIWRGAPLDPHSLIEESRRIEVHDAGIAGGWQDHQAAALGGALDLHYGSAYTATPLALTNDIQQALADRCLVFYTGESRISATSITAVLDAWVHGDARVRSALTRMRDLAGAMSAALRAGDIDTLGALVGEHWVHQRSLHPSIPTERIDAVLAAGLAAGAIGGKALGASGGGCVLLIARDGCADAIRRAVGALAEELPCRPAMHGVEIEPHTGLWT